MRNALRAGVLAGAVLLAVLALATSAAARAGSGLRSATTFGDAETEKTIPISHRAGAEPRVVLTLGPKRMPTLKRGDRLHALGEVQVTNTCVRGEPRCVGRPYSFSPRVSGWLVLAGGRRATGGKRARRISDRENLTCGQHRPNRNHHCVLVFDDAGMQVHSPGRLPCRPDRCHLNLVVAAHHPNARHGNRLIIGADRPNGSIEQGKGRVSALVIRQGAHPRAGTRATSHLLRHTVPMSGEREGEWVSVYSVRVSHLNKGDVLTAEARQILDIGGLGNAVFDSTRIILTNGRGRVESGRIARRSARPGPALDEANGFNCTQGPSAYQTPCFSHKVGQLTIRRPPTNHVGNPVPLYVNLIARGFLKAAQPKGGGAARLRRGGFLRVKHYRAE
jgi:hypothetical protein